MVPLNVRMDGVSNVQGTNVVRMPKLCQGAPYRFGLRVRLEDDSYRDWAEAVGIRWRIKLRPTDSADLLVLTKANGNFTIDSGSRTLYFIVKATDWEDVTIPRSENHMELDYPFSFTVEFLNAEGVVVERFAQGTGLISVNLD